MSNLVTGANIPKDLLAVLKKYGLPEHSISFKVECAGQDELVLITAKFYARLPEGAEFFVDVVETRTFKILAVE